MYGALQHLTGQLMCLCIGRVLTALPFSKHTHTGYTCSVPPTRSLSLPPTLLANEAPLRPLSWTMVP